MSIQSFSQPEVAVLFLTRRCSEGFPIEADMPASLLPLGWQSLVEHAMDQLHLAGISDIHLVTSDGAAQLRRLLGSGDRWGLRLHWHVTDSGTHPYRILRHLNLHQTTHVLVGHADRFVSASILQSLLSHGGVLCFETQHKDRYWSGWSCLPTEVVRGLGSHAPWPTLCDSMLALQGFFPAQLTQGLRDGDLLDLDNPDLYLNAQQRWMEAGWLEQAPLSWIRHPWGLQHPGAKVEAGDDWIAPVVVGPGCVVQAGAVLTGPVTLSRDVWLGSSVEVSNSVVMERSFVSSGLTLEKCVVNGTRLWRDGVKVNLPDSDAILTKLSSGMPLTRWLERAVGCLCAWGLLFLTWPFCLVVWTWMRASGRSAGWQQDFLCEAKGWMHVALGRWSWWGVRVRNQAQLAALPFSWRLDLEQGRVGVWHMSASDGLISEHSAEQEAAADLFWLLQMRESFLRLCVYRLGILRRSFMATLTNIPKPRLEMQAAASIWQALKKYRN